MSYPSEQALRILDYADHLGFDTIELRARMAKVVSAPTDYNRKMVRASVKALMKEVHDASAKLMKTIGFEPDDIAHVQLRHGWAWRWLEHYDLLRQIVLRWADAIPGATFQEPAALRAIARPDEEAGEPEEGV